MVGGLSSTEGKKDGHQTTTWSLCLPNPKQQQRLRLQIVVYLLQHQLLPLLPLRQPLLLKYLSSLWSQIPQQNQCLFSLVWRQLMGLPHHGKRRLAQPMVRPTTLQRIRDLQVPWAVDRPHRLQINQSLPLQLLQSPAPRLNHQWLSRQHLSHLLRSNLAGAKLLDRWTLLQL